ncbi:NUDIX domain-containing protein [Natrinema longum]|uniref:NUDIX domain-containing protein n=1 Tax=Natrinema longum TaxID=370324 RepID=A0A8A2U6J4_9EURY|nr:NUDIX domain-containing protein [Natrinema longum]MBZ6494474.1 NUDIX domain-containing protein [Natrinema longum]QSW84203.1 NUDIX domain-containing protein [Natrinema longum]
MSDSPVASDDPGSDDGETSHVVTAFLRNRGEVLLLRRSDSVGTYRGQWGGVSGFAEGQPDEQVRVEIREETGLEADDVSLVRSGRPITFADPALEREWAVHPYLFDCETHEIRLSDEHDAFEWVPPTAMLASVGDDRETVPELWTAYERVAPTVRSIAADGEHGAAYLSLRALEVLRDRAGVLVAERTEFGADPDGEWDELAELAGRILEARPSMAVLRNRTNRVMADANRGAGDGAAVLESAISTIDFALDADEDAAATASERFEDSVATLSRSGTVLEALERGEPSRVFVAESRPAREGIDVAERLSERTPSTVTVHTDAAIAHVLAREDIDRVAVGADTVLPDGSVVNKTGTRALAVAADREGIPVSVVATTDKVSTREGVSLESGERSAVYDGDASLDVLNPTFDVTPAECVTEFVTERGTLDPVDIGAVAAELRDLEEW